MCRLLAWHSSAPLTAEQVIIPDPNRLAELSRVHCDGWGFAELSESGRIMTVMGPEPAHESSQFAHVTQDVATRNGIVHLRWATGDLAVSLANTHPFTAQTPFGDVAFVHNGYIPDADDLIPDIDDDLVAAFRGETDSERYFGLFTTELRHEGGDIVSALRRTTKRLSDQAYTSINAMVLTTTHLAVLCQHKPENRPLDEDEDYFHLNWGVERGVISAWSMGVRPHAGMREPLENGTILLIDTRSGDYDIFPVV